MFVYILTGIKFIVVCVKDGVISVTNKENENPRTNNTRISNRIEYKSNPIDSGVKKIIQFKSSMQSGIATVITQNGVPLVRIRFERTKMPVLFLSRHATERDTLDALREQYPNVRLVSKKEFFGI